MRRTLVNGFPTAIALALMLLVAPSTSAAAPEVITLNGGQTTTTTTVFKKGSSYKVDIEGSVSVPGPGGGTYVVDAFYGQTVGGTSPSAPSRFTGGYGKAWGFDDSLERYTVNRVAPSAAASHVYSLTLDAVDNGTMDLRAYAGTGSFKITITPPADAPGTDQATLSGVKGKVEVSLDEGAWAPATNGMKIDKGDRIHTGFKASATLTLPDGSTVVVKQMSLVQLTELSRTATGALKTRLWLRLGELESHVVKSAGSAADFNVKTPTSTAGVRGTRFTTSYDGTAATFAVKEGIVSVTPDRGVMVLVNANTEVRATSSKVSAPTAIGASFRRGGFSSSEAVTYLSNKSARVLRRCGWTVKSITLSPTTNGWRAALILVKASEGFAARPQGTEKLTLRGRKISSGNKLGARLLKGCAKG